MVSRRRDLKLAEHSDPNLKPLELIWVAATQDRESLQLLKLRITAG
jgi:hypothetical protein